MKHDGWKIVYYILFLMAGYDYFGFLVLKLTAITHLRVLIVIFLLLIKERW